MGNAPAQHESGASGDRLSGAHHTPCRVGGPRDLPITPGLLRLHLLRRHAARRGEHLAIKTSTCPTTTRLGGLLTLEGSTQTAGRAWTDSARADEDRALKHRARKATRAALAPPELVQALRRHPANYAPGLAGRLFVTREGRAGVPLSAPDATPQSTGTVDRV
ncbi:hypothetical protein GCM10028802_28070 [Terrabacter terrigena]